MVAGAVMLLLDRVTAGWGAEVQAVPTEVQLVRAVGRRNLLADISRLCRRS